MRHLVPVGLGLAVQDIHYPLGPYQRILVVGIVSVDHSFGVGVDCGYRSFGSVLAFLLVRDQIRPSNPVSAS